MKHSVITNFYKELSGAVDSKERNKVLKALFLYVLERKPKAREYSMLFKLIKDFGHFIVFDALVSARYSTLEWSGNYWGYLIAICKNLMKEHIDSEQESMINVTDELYNQFKDFHVDDIERRREILSG